MGDFKESGQPPQQEQKKPKQHVWERDELEAVLLDIGGSISIIKDGKLAQLEPDINDPEKVVAHFDGGGGKTITLEQALELVNTTDPQELKALEDKKYEDMESDPKDPDVVNNGYCWQKKGDNCFEFGTCAGCGKFWGASAKQIECTCGNSVSLT